MFENRDHARNVIKSAEATLEKLDAALALPEVTEAERKALTNPTTHPLYPEFHKLGLHLMPHRELQDWKDSVEAPVQSAKKYLGETL